MENKTILNIGSIFAEIHLETAAKFIQEKMPDQDEEKQGDTNQVQYEDREPIGDYSVSYQEVRNVLDNIEMKWGKDNSDSNMLNKYYQRDLLYIYDRITLDMNYLGEYPDRNKEWLEKLLELKYEIRNLL